MATVEVDPSKILGILDRARQWITLAAALIAAIAVTIRGGSPGNSPPMTQPPSTIPTLPPGKPAPAADPLAAIGQIQFGSAGCSATIVGPRREDGRWDILTAAHCLKGQPESGRLKLRDGRVITVRAASQDARSDAAWLVTVDPHDSLPFALLADKLPEPGERVWHAGFGIDNPGIREDGEVVNGQNSDGQTQFILSVSSGDSGGGIALDRTGRILSSVCCTEARGRKANCWGCSVESARRIRPKQLTDDFNWSPIALPIKE